MAKKLTKSAMLSALAAKTELSKKQVGLVMDELIALAYKEAKNSFTIPGLGKLVLVNRKARIGRNPATGASINIPAKRVVKLRKCTGGPVNPSRPLYFCHAAYCMDFFVNAVMLRMPATRAASTTPTMMP